MAAVSLLVCVNVSLLRVTVLQEEAHILPTQVQKKCGSQSYTTVQRWCTCQRVEAICACRNLMAKQDLEELGFDKSRYPKRPKAPIPNSGVRDGRNPLGLWLELGRRSDAIGVP